MMVFTKEGLHFCGKTQCLKTMTVPSAESRITSWEQMPSDQRGGATSPGPGA